MLNDRPTGLWTASRSVPFPIIKSQTWKKFFKLSHSLTMPRWDWWFIQMRDTQRKTHIWGVRGEFADKYFVFMLFGEEVKYDGLCMIYAKFRDDAKPFPYCIPCPTPPNTPIRKNGWLSWAGLQNLREQGSGHKWWDRSAISQCSFQQDFGQYHQKHCQRHNGPRVLSP